MRKHVFERKKNTLAILIVFFVTISLTSTAVSAAYEIQHPHPGENHPGGHHFPHWHDHHNHHHHDHYYNGIYYSDYEWVYNPVTLGWDWTYIPVIEEVQPIVEQPIEAIPTITGPTIGTSGSVTPITAGSYHEHKYLDHAYLGDKDHDDHNDHNDDHHDHHDHNYDDCWAWSPTKEQWVYIC
jgi:ABC-type Zn2+ transport system substrate-binding protein/surface adhesin